MPLPTHPPVQGFSLWRLILQKVLRKLEPAFRWCVGTNAELKVSMVWLAVVRVPSIIYWDRAVVFYSLYNSHTRQLEYCWPSEESPHPPDDDGSGST